jgi:xylan 1,4-beta-xylosidase
MIQSLRLAFLAAICAVPATGIGQPRMQNDSGASPANAPLPIATPSPGAIVPPPRTRLLGAGISGPGSIVGPNWAKVNEQVTGSAVKEGLLPPLKALANIKMRDTYITLGGDGNYYMTGSTGDEVWKYNDGIELWRSPDLKKWDYVGLVWSFAKDATWQKDWHYSQRPVRAIWAPELHYIKGNYYLTISMPPGNRGILKSSTGKPEGPYVNALPNDGYFPGEIDASLFVDDDGKIYMVYRGLWIVRLKDDLSGLAEEPRHPLFPNPDLDPKHHSPSCATQHECKDIGVEAPFLFKKDGKYYFTAADRYEGRYSSIATVSNNIYGPYEMRHEAVPCAGGTNYFKDKEGNWWCGFYGNDNQAPWREKPAIMRVEFDKQGRIHVAKKQPAWVLESKQ